MLTVEEAKATNAVFAAAWERLVWLTAAYGLPLYTMRVTWPSASAYRVAVVIVAPMTGRIHRNGFEFDTGWPAYRAAQEIGQGIGDTCERAWRDGLAVVGGAN